MTLLTFVRDGDTGRPLLALLADDGKGKLLSNPATVGLTDAAWQTYLAEMDPPPETALDYIRVMARVASYTDQIEPVAEVANMKVATKIANDTFANDGGDDERYHALDDDNPNTNTARAWTTLVTNSQETTDAMYETPDDEDLDIDDQAMLNYVMMSMGPIDPDGPNAWLLDAAEGKPVPEGAYLHFGQPGDESEVSDGDTTAGR